MFDDRDIPSKERWCRCGHRERVHTLAYGRCDGLVDGTTPGYSFQPCACVGFDAQPDHLSR